MYGVLWLREAVVRETGLTSRFDQPHPTEICEMSRDGGLRQTKYVHDVAHAELASCEHAQNTDARGVSEPLEDRVETVDGRLGAYR